MIDVGDVITKLAAGTVPNITADADEKLVPVNVTLVPPTVVPPVVPREVTVGTEARV
jgi:hypothetical protein